MTRSVCLLALLAVLTVPAIAVAELYTYRFTGTVTTVADNTAGLSIDQGQTFTGFFSFNDVNDGNNNGDVAEYNQNASISLYLPNITLALSNQPTQIYMYNDTNGLRADTFGFLAQGRQAGYQFSAFYVHLIDTTDRAFANTDLPPVLNVSGFTQHTLTLTGASAADPALTFNIIGDLTEVTRVPEPATLALLALGALALRRRR